MTEESEEFTWILALRPTGVVSAGRDVGLFELRFRKRALGRVVDDRPLTGVPSPFPWRPLSYSGRVPRTFLGPQRGRREGVRDQPAAPGAGSTRAAPANYRREALAPASPDLSDTGSLRRSGPAQSPVPPGERWRREPAVLVRVVRRSAFPARTFRASPEAQSACAAPAPPQHPGASSPAGLGAPCACRGRAEGRSGCADTAATTRLRRRRPGRGGTGSVPGDPQHQGRGGARRGEGLLGPRAAEGPWLRSPGRQRSSLPSSSPGPPAA